MSELDRLEIDALARLARIGLEPGEARRLAADLSRLIARLGPLRETPPARGTPTGEPTPLRDDLPDADRLALPLDELSPAVREGHFEVPGRAHDAGDDPGDLAGG